MSEVVVRTVDAGTARPVSFSGRSARARTRRRRIGAGALICADVVSASAALMLAGGVTIWTVSVPLHAGTSGFVAALAAGILLPAIALRLYVASALSPLERFRARIIAAGLVPPIGIGALALASPIGLADVLVLVTAAILHLPLSLLLESSARNFLLRRGLWGEDVVVIGAGGAAATVSKDLLANPQLGLHPVGTWAPRSDARQHTDEADPALREDIAAMSQAADVLVIAMDANGPPPAITELPFSRIVVVPPAIDGAAASMATRDLAGRVGIEIVNPMTAALHRWGKRAIDLLVAVPALLLVLPLIALMSLIIRIISPGPAIFVQQRVGWQGRPVGIFKLRSMYLDAGQRLDDLLRSNPRAREEWETYVKISDDPRVLPVIGDFIRKASIDELPQLWNVIRGDISLVGPRPFPAYHVAKFDPAFQQLRSSVRPGLTGLWQVTDRSGATLERQQSLDTYYIRNWSLWLDLYIVWRTLPAILSTRGAR